MDLVQISLRTIPRPRCSLLNDDVSDSGADGDEHPCFAHAGVSCRVWEDEDEEEASGPVREEPPGVQEDHSP